MTTVPFIDLTISLILIFFLLSIICSGIVEWLNDLTIRQKRQVILYKSIAKALNDPFGLNWGELLYRHPEVHNMKRMPNRYPVYISGKTFANVVCDLIIQNLYLEKFERSPENPNSVEISKEEKEKLDKLSSIDKIRKGIDELKSGNFKTLLESFLIDISDDKPFDQFKQDLGAWYDNYQDRVSGWYKKTVNKDLFWIAFLMALVCNINTITIVQSLLQDDELRNSLVEKAIEVTGSYEPKKFGLNELCPGCSPVELDSTHRYLIARQLQLSDSLSKELSAFGLPIGWNSSKSLQDDSVLILRTKIENFKIKKRDTLALILNRACYVKSSSDSCSGNINHDKIDECECLCRNNIDSCDDSYVKVQNQMKKEIGMLEQKLGSLQDKTTSQLSWTSIGNFFKVNQLDTLWGFVLSFIGWFLTAFAASKGSNFWFEALVKLTNIRNAGGKPKRAT